MAASRRLDRLVLQIRPEMVFGDRHLEGEAYAGSDEDEEIALCATIMGQMLKDPKLLTEILGDLGTEGEADGVLVSTGFDLQTVFTEMRARRHPGSLGSRAVSHTGAEAGFTEAELRDVVSGYSEAELHTVLREVIEKLRREEDGGSGPSERNPGTPVRGKLFAQSDGFLDFSGTDCKKILRELWARRYPGGKVGDDAELTEPKLREALSVYSGDEFHRILAEVHQKLRWEEDAGEGS
mmetsp:Transcript_140500/g.436891  ORF Transcript_140500/g.436891 Transcript_140500/m.436891 type:complete len:238 (-) Transcript_140500:53-766(-)